MDPFSLDEADTPERQAALAAALRRREDLGQLFQLTGDKVLAPLGQNLMSSADRGEQRLDTAKQRRLQLNLEAKKDQEMQLWRQDQADERKREFGLRLTDLKDRRAFMAEAKAQRDAAIQEQKDNARKDKLFAPFAEEFDAAKGRNNLNAKLQAQIQRGEELETLLNSPGPMNPQKVEEATAMAAFIANGGNVPSVEQIRGMKPHTFSGEMADWYQFVSGHPTDAGVKEFMAQMGQQSERIKKVGKAQITRSFLEKISKHPDVLRNYPEDAARRLDAVGITPDMYDSKTLKPLVDPVAKAMAEAAKDDTKKPVKYLVRPDGKVRVPVFADGSKGAEEPNQ